MERFLWHNRFMKEGDISSDSKKLEAEKSASGEGESEFTTLKKQKEEAEGKNREMAMQMDFLKRQVAATVNHYKYEHKSELAKMERNKGKMLEKMICMFQELSRAIENEEDDAKSSFFLSLKTKVEAVIESNDGKIINPEVGAEFNPREHKALSTRKTKEKDQCGKIAELLTAGITMGDRVIMPANVVTFVED